MPTIEQLAEVIAAGDDSVLNRLILRTDGNFELVPIRNADDDLRFNNLQYVTRWESFDAGNDYVGYAASKDTKFLNEMMKWFEEAWDKYKETGQTNIMNPYC